MALRRSLWPCVVTRGEPTRDNPRRVRLLGIVLVAPGRARRRARRARGHREPAVHRRRGRRRRDAGRRRAPRSTASTARAAFDLLSEQVELGPRPAGSRASRELAERLRRLAARRALPAVPGGPAQRGRHGARAASRRLVVVGAHYDTKDLPGFVGANDGASGTAVVVELARTIRPRRRPTIVFVLFDGEESPRGAPDDATSSGAGCAAAKVAARALRRGRGDGPARLRRRARPAHPARGELRPERCGTSCGRPRAASGTAACSPPTTRAAILDDHIPFIEQGVPVDRPDRLRLPLLARALRRPRARSRSAASTPSARRCTSCCADSERGLASLATWPQHPKSCCWPRRAATARASTAPCRPSSARSSSTAPPVYVRKEIVHNKHVVEQLRERGAIFVDQETEVPEGETVVFSAHGVAPSVHANAERAQLQDDRRHLPARDQGARGGQEVRRRGLHDRPDRPRRPRGGRGHDGRGARPHRARRDRGRRGRARGRRPRPRRLPLPDHALGGRDRPHHPHACASASPTSPARAPTTSVTPPPTARWPSARWRASATSCW